MASDFKNGVAHRPLVAPNPDDAMQERLAAARDRYAQAIADAIDAETSQFILPGDKLALIDDAFGFMGFVLTLKAVEAFQQKPDKLNLMRAWGKLYRDLARAVPESLLQFAAATTTARGE